MKRLYRQIIQAYAAARAAWELYPMSATTIPSRLLFQLLDMSNCVAPDSLEKYESAKKTMVFEEASRIVDEF